jgi:hypothetical protein
MPYHSSKKYYKAEQELSDALEKEDYDTFHQLCCDYCEFDENSCKSAFDTEWTYSVGTSTHGPLRCTCCLKESCKYVGCTCDYCYELNRWNSQAILEKYFTAEQLLTYNSSLPSKHISRFYCNSCKRVHRQFYNYYNNGLGNVCMNKIYIDKEGYYYEYKYCMKKLVPCTESLIVKKKGLYDHILSDKYGLQQVEPQKLNMEMVSDHTLDYFIAIHRQNVFEYHQQKYDRDTAEMLKKYGLTLTDYKKRKCAIETD